MLNSSCSLLAVRREVSDRDGQLGLLIAGELLQHAVGDFQRNHGRKRGGLSTHSQELRKETRSLGRRGDRNSRSESCREVRGGSCGQEKDVVTRDGSCRRYWEVGRVSPLESHFVIESQEGWLWWEVSPEWGGETCGSPGWSVKWEWKRVWVPRKGRLGESEGSSPSSEILKGGLLMNSRKARNTEGRYYKVRK